MSYPITPAASVHNLPPAVAAQQALLNQQALQAMGQRLIQAVVKSILSMVTGGLLGGLGTNSGVAIGQFTNVFTNLFSTMGISNVASTLAGDIASFNPTAILTHWVNNLLGPLGLLTLGGGSTATLQQLQDAIVQALGGLGTGNPLTSVQQFLQQIPGLNIVGQMRPSVATILPAAHVSTVNPELLANPGLSSSIALSSTSSRITYDATTGRTTPGSLLIQPDGNFLYSVVSNPIPVVQGDMVAMSIYAKWSGLTYISGGAAPIRLEVLEYYQGNRVASITVAKFNSPASSSSWLQLSETTYVVPANVDTVYLRPVVDDSATAGSVWFDDASVTKQGPIPVSSVPQLPTVGVNGVQGIQDIGTTIQGMWDKLVSGFTGVPSTNVSLSAVSSAAQSTAQTASGAASLAQTNSNILGIRNNQPVSAGLEATVEANLSLESLGTGATPSSVAVTQAASAGGFVRCAQTATKGFVQWYGSGNANITHFYVNVYKMDVSGNLNLLFTSGDLVTSLTPGWSWIIYNFPGINDIAVNPGDVIGIEYQVVGTGTHNVAGLSQTWQSNHPTANTKQSGLSKNWGTGAASTITAASVPYTGSTPYVGLGVSNLPANYQPPTTWHKATAGTYTYPIPTWMAAGNFIDLIVLGAGGGSGGSVAYVPSEGAKAGHWVTRTLQCGVDFPVTATSMSVTVGLQGAAGGTGSSGLPGGISSVTYTDTLSHPQTVSANGGDPGSSGSTTGLSPGDQVLNGVTYWGGSSVGLASWGSPPGGGAGGASPYGFGNDGADGAVWIVARQT